MNARLFCKTGELKGKRCTLGREATIGKDSASTLCLSPSILSRHHARIFFDEKEGCYFLEDLNSRNGTWLDGSRVTQPEKLHSLHVITFGNKFDFIFQMVEDGALSRRHAGRRESDDATRIEAPVGASGGSAPEDRTQIGGGMTPMPPIGEPPSSKKKEDEMGDKTLVNANVILPIPTPQGKDDRTEKLDMERGSK
jgi:hypothetical protein